jgi:secernin
MVFAKNSDRQRNEAQAVEWHEGAEYEEGARVSCTYQSIPQTRRTYSVLLSRPFWMWGAEMGANEHGLVIGNEGLHARMNSPQDNALTGMDLVRLGLERARSAREALDVITGLLQQYGQGGNCGHLVPAYYNNGFMIADCGEAFVLETVGREWWAERVRGIRAISNRYSIVKPDSESVGVPALLGKLRDATDAPNDYSSVVSDRQREHVGQALERQTLAAGVLRSSEGTLDVAAARRTLRRHGSSERDAAWDPKIQKSHGLCVHAGANDRPAQTTGSMVSELRECRSVHWVTGTSAPCISLFKPVIGGTPIPLVACGLTDKFDASTLWWRHEILHRRAIIGDFAKFLADIALERDQIEVEFDEKIGGVLDGGSIRDRALIVAECWKVASEAEDRWLRALANATNEPSSSFRLAWEQMNDAAGLDAADFTSAR